MCHFFNIYSGGGVHKYTVKTLIHLSRHYFHMSHKLDVQQRRGLDSENVQSSLDRPVILLIMPYYGL